MDESPRRIILVVDLENELSEQIMLTEVQMRRFAGGRFLALHLWQHHRDGNGLDSASYEAGNPMVFAASPAAELDVKTPPSYVVVTRNPTTASISCSVGSSTLGSGILACGYLAVVLIGRMRRLGGVLIDERGATFTSAEEYHNRGTIAVARSVQSEHIVVTGPAGEQYSPYASLYADGENIGPGGIGMVLGRKNVKYIAFNGEGARRESGDVKRQSLYNKRAERRIGHSKTAAMIARHGDLALVKWANTHGWAAIEGWSLRRDGRLWALTDKIALMPAHITLSHALALGPNLGLFEVGSIARLARRCLDNGLDPVAISALLCWARESRAEGLLSFLPDLRHPEVPLYEQMLDGIAYRRGSGGMELAYPLDELVKRHGGAQHAYLVAKSPIAPFDLRALPATALLTAMGDDTIVYSELLGGNRYRRGNERTLAKEARFAQVIRASAACVGCHHNALIDFSKSPRLFAKRRCFLLLAAAASLGEARTISIADVVEYGRASLDLEAAINEELHGGRTASLPERMLIDGTSNYPKAQVVPLARLLDAYRSVRVREKQRDPSETR